MVTTASRWRLALATLLLAAALTVGWSVYLKSFVTPAQDWDVHEPGEAAQLNDITATLTDLKAVRSIEGNYDEVVTAPQGMVYLVAYLRLEADARGGTIVPGLVSTDPTIRWTNEPVSLPRDGDIRECSILEPFQVSDCVVVFRVPESLLGEIAGFYAPNGGGHSVLRWKP